MATPDSTMPRVSPQNLFVRLDAILPGFASFWDDPRNCFREDDGSFTPFGVFNLFYTYYLEHRSRMPADRSAALGALVSECMASGDGELADAAAMGFLEGAEFDPGFARHLAGEALRYYSLWK